MECRRCSVYTRGICSSGSRRRSEQVMKRFLKTLALLLTFCSVCAAQQVVDKMVATVNSGVRTELITYSDLLWQLALQPDTPLDKMHLTVNSGVRAELITYSDLLWQLALQPDTPLDKMVATVNSGVRTELITYSD